MDISPRLLKAFNALDALYQIYLDLGGIRESHGQVEVLVEWEGLPGDTDHTWEPLPTVRKVLADLLEDYLHIGDQRTLKRRALAQVTHKSN